MICINGVTQSRFARTTGPENLEPQIPLPDSRNYFLSLVNLLLHVELESLEGL